MRMFRELGEAQGTAAVVQVQQPGSVQQLQCTVNGGRIEGRKAAARQAKTCWAEHVAGVGNGLRMTSRCG
jgi:hypothetical protein